MSSRNGANSKQRKKQSHYAKIVHERKQKKEHIANHKRAHPCKICGENDILCLAFHHREPALKRFTINSSSANKYNMQSVIEEIRKCDVLCFNCHAKLHNGHDEPHRKPQRAVGD